MTEPTELLAGTVTNLQNAITPLIHPQPDWHHNTIRIADPLYTRMRQALTATSLKTGATTTKSKPPARIDVLDWLTETDYITRIWDNHKTVPERLNHLYDKTWTPDDIQPLKALTRHCERWTHTARELLGDNPITVPLHGTQCPHCEATHHYRRSGNEQLRQPALTVGEHGAHCHACGRKWISDSEQALFKKMLGITE